MGSKFKFQIARSLDDRIKLIASDVNEFEPEFANVDTAYVLGNRQSSTTNHVGLTTDYIRYHAGCEVVGLALFKSSASPEAVIEKLTSVQQCAKSNQTIQASETDRTCHLYLVYAIDEETKAISKKVFDLENNQFLEQQPKLSILDDNKLYNHSALVKLTLSIKLNLLGQDGKVVNDQDLASKIDDAKACFANDTKELKLHLLNSNFSTSTPLSNKNSTETLYEHLDPPADVLQMGDYLPKMTKKDKELAIGKWRNKVKDQRVPLEMKLEHERLSYDDDEKSLAATEYGLSLEDYVYIHVNDTIAKSTQVILHSLRHRLDLLKRTLTGRAGKGLAKDEIKSCTFKIEGLNHLVPSVYLIPCNEPDYELLKQQRKQLHDAYLVPLSEPKFRYSQRIVDLQQRNTDELAGYLCNVHATILDQSGIKNGLRSVLHGTYTYHHYLQDKASDSGWGCAYRSLQTIISWFKHQAYLCSPDVPARACEKADKTKTLRDKLARESRVPSHAEIQQVLVDVGDKQENFVGSEKWIGSQEVCYVLSHLYDIESKFISVSSGDELPSKVRDLAAHFGTQSTPVMIGGGVLAHTIIGVDFHDKTGDIRYLIVDPHYTGAEDVGTITKKGWCGWKKNNFWDKSAFYNLCLPQRPREY